MANEKLGHLGDSGVVTELYSEEDELGRQRVGYRSSGPDDFLHAEVYDVVATNLWLLRQAVMELQREEYVALDDLVDFRRSRVADYEDNQYSFVRQTHMGASPSLGISR